MVVRGGTSGYIWLRGPSAAARIAASNSFSTCVTANLRNPAEVPASDIPLKKRLLPERPPRRPHKPSKHLPEPSGVSQTGNARVRSRGEDPGLVPPGERAPPPCSRGAAPARTPAPRDRWRWRRGARPGQAISPLPARLESRVGEDAHTRGARLGTRGASRGPRRTHRMHAPSRSFARLRTAS